MKIFIDAIGCRLNQAEIEKIGAQLRAAGHELLEGPQGAEMVVVNTCAVTSEAASDSRQKIRQAQRAGARQIIVTGCWATLEPDEAAAIPGVTRVVDNNHKLEVAACAPGRTPGEGTRLPARLPLPGSRARTRAFIAVQTGCDNHCTFCITRIARGQSRSYPVDSVLEDVRAALAGGANEVVLTGVQIGSWGRELNPPKRLHDLIFTILDETTIPRLRLSSLEPWELDEDFFALWQDQRLCRHLHLPLQSGCAATLHRMGRKTSPAEYARLLEQARTFIPGLTITTDVMVGFPGESDDEFSESLEFVRRMNFTGGHVFHFSARQGTPAEKLPGTVPFVTRKQRSIRMRAVLAESENAVYQAWIGQTMDVLWETCREEGGGKWRLKGLTDNYLRVSAVSRVPLWNTISPVRFISCRQAEIYGEIMQ